LQEALGREVKVYASMEEGQIVASALVIVDRTSFGLSTWDIPRGPLAGSSELVAGSLLEKIIEDAKAEGSMALYCSPLQSLPATRYQLLASGRHIYPEASRVIDLTQSEELLLQQMKPKGRYNIGLAEKHGVRVTVSDDIDAYAALSAETGKRDGFTPQQTKTYRAFLESIPQSFLLLAYAPSEGSSTSSMPSLPSTPSSKPIAGLLGLIWGKTGIYYYGASGSQFRELMAPYLLQWKAIKLCKARGCESYDLFGIAPEGQSNHPWAGVSEFKAKFGGAVETYPAERMVVLRPMIKMGLEWKRKMMG
jgi:lipid II:glycine glycyltransferase (peptidoglycan interpeptide bridge formation enzyme)